MQKRIEQLQLKDVRIIWLKKSALGPDDEDAVRRLAARYSATLVIWGWYDRASFRANFTVTEQFSAASQPDLVERHASLRSDLSSELDFSLWVNKALPHQAEFFMLFTLAQLYYWEKEYDQAYYILTQAIDSAVDIPAEALAYAYFYHGNINACYRNDRPATIADFRRALELNPGLLPAAYNLGDALRVWGNTLAARDETTQAELAFQDAIQAFSRVLELDPNLGRAFEQRGLAHFKAQAYMQAANDYQEALARRPSAEISNQLAMALRHLGRLEEALEAMNDAINRAPGFGQYYFNRARVRIALQDLSGAAQDFRDYLRLAQADHPDRRQNVRNWLDEHGFTVP